MNSIKLVSDTIKGHSYLTTPVYGWVRENLKEPITKAFGSVEAFEDHYKFDMAHLFGGPDPFNTENINDLKNNKTIITPEMALDLPLSDFDYKDDYKSIIKDLDWYRVQRERFSYVQTPGILECLNDLFGIENHMMYMALYPEMMKEIYKRQAIWNKGFAGNMMDLGVDMIHVSDDWGGQKNLMISKTMWMDYIYPNHKIVADSVKARDVFLSLHSDGNINLVLDEVAMLGYDVVHPWQETAGMSYETYLNKYQDKFAILGGLCVQSMLGYGDYSNVEKHIRRLFKTLKNKRWIFCTTHYVQDHCSIEELVFAYDLAVELARN